jgi:hypothetical protein
MGLGEWLRNDGRMTSAVCRWLVFSGMVFRAELVAMFIPMIIGDLLAAYLNGGWGLCVSRVRRLLVSSLPVAISSLGKLVCSMYIYVICIMH